MAGEELIAQHQKMVLGLAGRLRRELSLSGDVEDLIAFGFSGLLEAEQRYDPSRGVRFQTFAYYRVRGAMLDGVRKMANLPRRAHQRLKAEAERAPTAAPTLLDKAFTRMSASLTSASPVQSSFAEESPESALLRNESIERLLGALSRLSARERALIRGRYFEGRPLEELAADLGVSKSWASRIHTQALSALRAALDAP
jgi:RNA polymerase sigma factor for flagellar operon FliA